MALADSSVMKMSKTSLPGVLILEPRVFSDERGFFLESYNQKILGEAGIEEVFVQDNHSFSRRNVLRGLHYQVKHAQGKLVRVAAGEVLDVAVDLRKSSPAFGKWQSVRLSGENHRLLWIPAGFAHGFRVISEGAHVLYKATDFYFPEFEHTLAWNDPALGVNWELDGEPVVSAKDGRGVLFKQAAVYD